MSTEDKQDEAEKNQEEELSAEDLKLVSGGSGPGVFNTVGNVENKKI